MKPSARESGRLGGDYSLVIAGALSLLLSLGFFPLFSLRPNRVSSGIGIRLLQVSPLYFAAIALLAVVFAFILQSSAASRRRRIFAVSAFLGIAILLVLLPALAEGLVKSFVQGFGGAASGLEIPLPAVGSPGQGAASAIGPSSRISLGLGYWAALGFVFVIYAGAEPLAGVGRGLKCCGVAAALLMASLALAGAYDGLSLFKEFALRSQTFGRELLRHVAYALFPSLAALLIAIPLGWASSSKPWMDRFFFFIANMAQVVPTLALIGLLIGPLAALGRLAPGLGVRGTGWAPASIALFLYALLPLLANAKAGFAMIDPSVRDVAKGMGMKPIQVFFRVELPLAAGALAAGFRTALAQNMGNAVLAGLVGGGGLGSLIFLGLAQAAPDLVLLGSLAVAAAALVADRGLGRAERSFAAYSKGRAA